MKSGVLWLEMIRSNRPFAGTRWGYFPIRIVLRPGTRRKINAESDADKWAASSEFVSSSIPSWQILTAHAQPLKGARDLAFWLKVPLDSLRVWASSEGSGETKGHLCLRRVFSLITKVWSESFDFALSLLLTHVVYRKTNIIMCDRQWFT